MVKRAAPVDDPAALRRIQSRAGPPPASNKRSSATSDDDALRRVQSRAGPPPTSNRHKLQERHALHIKARQAAHVTPSDDGDESASDNGDGEEDGDFVGEESEEVSGEESDEEAAAQQPRRKPSAPAAFEEDSGDDEADEEDDDESDEELDDESDEEDAPPPSRRPLPRPLPQAQAPSASGSEPDSGPDAGGGSSGDDDSDEDERDMADRTLEQHVADLPFEALERLRSDGSGPAGAVARAAAAAALKRQEKFKRANRHRPSEASSKRPVSRFREVLPAPSRRGRDPRFDALAGPAVPPAASGRHGPAAVSNEDAAFRKRYAFLFEEVLPGEKQELRDRLKRVKDPVKKAAMQGDIARIEQRLVEDTRKRKQMELEAQFKSKQKSAVLSGQKPFYLKASERKKMELAAKFEELKSKGGLDKYMEKRRRKNAAKDHRYIPRASRREDA